MKIGILVSFMNNFGQKGLYNSQEIGLAKALAKRSHEVIVYKLVRQGAPIPDKENIQNVRVFYSPTKALGANGMVDTSVLDKSLDKLVYFADTQLAVLKVSHWCRRNQVDFIPYVGVAESHSENKIIRLVLDSLFLINLYVYKREGCLAKTTTVKKFLLSKNKNIKNIKVAPVGIDFDLLNLHFQDVTREKAKSELGFSSRDKIAVLIGRLEADRNPLDVVTVFKRIRQIDCNYKLLIIGKGTLKEELFKLLRREGLEAYVKYIEQVPNKNIWKMYRASDVLLTFSRTEIFGMSILEAMYYGTVVHAIQAPGPKDIIENKKSGYLYTSLSNMLECIGENLYINKELVKHAHDRVINQFSWSFTAMMVEEHSIKGEH